MKKTLILVLLISALLLSACSDSLGGSSNISAGQARQIALGRYPGTRVVDVDFERDYGRPLWDVDLSNGRSVYVDARSGAIVEVESWDGGWYGDYDNDRDWDDWFDWD